MACPEVFEALLSSQIEGAQSSLSDLLLFERDEAPGVPLDETRNGCRIGGDGVATQKVSFEYAGAGS